MKIVVLDGDPALGSGPSACGKIDASALFESGEVTIYDRTEPDQVIARAKDADVILTNKVALQAEHLTHLPKLKLISVLATGVNVVDLKSASEHGITVCNVPGYSTASTAQHTFALLLELSNRVGLHSAEVRTGAWSESPAFSYFRTPLTELEALTLGIVGFGAIGRRVASLGAAFGMKIVVHTRSQEQAEGVPFVSKSELLSSSDVVTLHCPLTDDTRHFIDKEALALMKKSAFLINVSRGPVVDEDALARALSLAEISGAAIDVLDQEPPPGEHRLCQSPNCLVTPHIAWASTAARKRLLEISIENIRAFLRGQPIHVVAAPKVPH
jgi:glycerate dehydrogenase